MFGRSADEDIRRQPAGRAIGTFDMRPTAARAENVHGLTGAKRQRLRNRIERDAVADAQRRLPMHRQRDRELLGVRPAGERRRRAGRPASRTHRRRRRDRVAEDRSADRSPTTVSRQAPEAPDSVDTRVVDNQGTGKLIGNPDHRRRPAATRRSRAAGAKVVVGSPQKSSAIGGDRVGRSTRQIERVAVDEIRPRFGAVGRGGVEMLRRLGEKDSRLLGTIARETAWA